MKSKRPKGVEHVGTAVLNALLVVMNSKMPKGVEHSVGHGIPGPIETVMNSKMPKGRTSTAAVVFHAQKAWPH